MWVGSNICFGFIVCSPQHQGCWSFRKCQEGVKVLDDFKWREGWSCPGWANFVAVGRMVLAHRYCWAQGFKEQPMENPFENPWENTWEKKNMGFFPPCLLSPSITVATCLFGRGVQFNQPAFDQKTMKVSSWILPQFLWPYGWKTRWWKMMNTCSLKTRPSISQRQKERYDLWKMMLVDAISCWNMSCTCIHHTLLITDKCCIVTVKNCQI